MKALHAFLAVLLLLPALPASADTPSADAPVIVMPSQLQWVSSPMLPPGGKVAVLQGDYTKAGWYTLRFSLPDGASFAPHAHGTTEYVTVLQGTLMVGLGDTVDKSKMTALPAGSFVAVPAGVHHYATARGDTIIQLSGMGPMTMVEVKPGSM
jgi:quercetin dioxygenase-like cupin family protein